MKILLRHASVALMSIAVFAGTASAREQEYLYPLEPAQFQAPQISQEQFEKNIAEMQALAKRKVAQVDKVDDNTALSAEYRSIREKLLAVSNTDDLNKRLLELKAKGKDWKNADARLVSAQLQMYLPFRGFVYRARDIFDTSSGNAKLAHASAVTILRMLAAGTEAYFPKTKHAAAAFDYAVEPTYASEAAECSKENGWSERCDISNGEKLQMWLRKEFLPQLMVLHDALNTTKLDVPLYWDNQMVFGRNATFTSDKDRYQRLGEVERYAMLASVQATISAVYTACSYSFEGFFESFDAFSTVYGFQAQFDEDKANPKDRFDSIRKFPNLFAFRRVKDTSKSAAVTKIQDKLKALKNRVKPNSTPASGNYDPEAIGYMKTAYEWLKAALLNGNAAWEYLRDSKGDPNNLLDPRVAQSFARVGNAISANTFAIVGISRNREEVKDAKTLSAVFAGQKVIVKLKEFYQPQDGVFPDLQDFMPTGFDGSGSAKRVKTVDNKQVSYRDYRDGRPANWNYKLYGKYFDGVNSDDDVKNTARTLIQSWGGLGLALPMGAMMM